MYLSALWHVLIVGYFIPITCPCFHFFQHNVVSSQPIDGFFIYYKPFHAEVEFEKIPLLSSSVRAYLLQGLQPGTEYLIKMQSFNSAGQSPFSNEVVERTPGRLTLSSIYTHKNNIEEKSFRKTL